MNKIDNIGHLGDELSILLNTTIKPSRHGPCIDIWYFKENIGRLNMYNHISWVDFKQIYELYSKDWTSFQHSWY